MILIKFTAGQREALREVLRRYPDARPSATVYHRELQQLSKVSDVPRFHRPTRTHNYWPTDSFGNRWPVPTAVLDAGFSIDDLPEGYAVYPLYDSAGTQAFSRAAEWAWTRLWNYWKSDTPAISHGLIHTALLQP